jgi:hypothetical protein
LEELDLTWNRIEAIPDCCFSDFVHIQRIHLDEQMKSLLSSDCFCGGDISDTDCKIWLRSKVFYISFFAEFDASGSLVGKRAKEGEQNDELSIENPFA